MYRSAANAYKSVRVKSASPAQILDEVFGRITLDCQRAKDAIASGDVAARCDQVGHALKLVGALEASLDTALAPELCANLKQLYVYVRGLLVDANLEATTEPIDEAMGLVQEIHESFLAAKAAA